MNVRERTCIATRQRKPERELLRLVAHRDEEGKLTVVPDPRRRMPGRGAWITPTTQSWEVADKRRAFGRALKVSTGVDANPVLQYLRHLAESPDGVQRQDSQICGNRTMTKERPEH
ncbi:YlxR family protein [Corynebacterium sp. H78]|uniref:YlxR family protein n=1 Tax=Corynebacterium sp. H78 TaxID=3133417 RepID=UPI0030AC9518